jgi:hypothetical protein
MKAITWYIGEYGWGGSRWTRSARFAARWPTDRLRVVAERVSPLNRLDVVIAYHRETGAPGPAA